VGDTYVSIEGLVGSMLNDGLVGDGGNNNFYGNAGADFIFGRTGDDYLNGGPDGDHLFGEEGSDFLVGSIGADVLDGGAGFDFAGYDSASSGVTARLDNPAGNSGEAAGDTYVSIEGLMGSNFNDSLFGEAGDNVIYGLGGNDVIVGNGGNDTLIGGLGNDTFVFNAPSGLATILDFVQGSDLLQVLATGFGHGLVANGTPTVVQASSNAVASDAGTNGYFIFDNAGVALGTLYWDANGGSGADAVAIAVLQNVTSLAASDFHLV
jgi:serralysin